MGLALGRPPDPEAFGGELGGSAMSEEAFAVLWPLSFLSSCLEALRLFRRCHYGMSDVCSLMLSGVPEGKLFMEGDLGGRGSSV